MMEMNGGGELMIRRRRRRRLLLLAFVILSLPLLRRALFPAAAINNGDELHLPILIADLNDRGYVHHDDRAVFLGNAGSWSPFLEHNNVVPVNADELEAVPDMSVNFVVGGGNGVDFSLVDRVLKVGGVAAVFSITRPFLLPNNYKLICTHHSTAMAFAAMKIGSSIRSTILRPYRRLLAVQKVKKVALDGLEGVLLEPPQKRQSLRRLRPKFLSELIGDSLETYQRRVFIDVTPSTSSSTAAAWFQKYYPKGNREFDIVHLKVVLEPASAQKAAEGIGDWLESNVREEDYVVVKAGVEAVEEMLRKGSAAVRRVDELFLECGEGDHGEEAAGRPYWQCLALYGRLRDHGIAMHQWWGVL